MARRFGNRYDVIKCLGSGKFGTVYLCNHLELSGHYVAIKILHPELVKDDAARERFRNEIVASYSVSHPNVVRNYEYFQDSDFIGYSMEFADGGDLGHDFQNVPFENEKVVRCLSELAAGLQAIHDAGLHHKDLKPEKILLLKDGTVKISDAGFSPSARQTNDPAQVRGGTIDYVAPEYLESGIVDVRTDLYAAGVIAYEMLTGILPFQADSVTEALTMRLKEIPLPPTKTNPRCPDPLNGLVMRLLKRDPSERIQSAKELFEELANISKDYLRH